MTYMHLGEFYTLRLVCGRFEGGNEAPHTSWQIEQARSV